MLSVLLLLMSSTMTSILVLVWGLQHFGAGYVPNAVSCLGKPNTLLGKLDTILG